MLSRLAEGEAAPDEALRLARHLPDCTACRILLASEVRLAGMLDGLDDSIAVEEGFLQRVMDSLPADPPPVARRRWSGLKLAGFAGALLVVGAAASRLAALFADGRLVPLVPRIEIANTEHLLEALAGVARLVGMVLDRVGANLAPDLPTLHLYARIGLAALLPAAAALLTVSTLVALLARARLRN